MTLKLAMEAYVCSVVGPVQQKLQCRVLNRTHRGMATVGSTNSFSTAIHVRSYEPRVSSSEGGC